MLAHCQMNYYKVILLLKRKWMLTHVCEQKMDLNFLTGWKKKEMLMLAYDEERALNVMLHMTY